MGSFLSSSMELRLLLSVQRLLIVYEQLRTQGMWRSTHETKCSETLPTVQSTLEYAARDWPSEFLNLDLVNQHIHSLKPCVLIAIIVLRLWQKQPTNQHCDAVQISLLMLALWSLFSLVRYNAVLNKDPRVHADDVLTCENWFSKCMRVTHETR